MNSASDLFIVDNSDSDWKVYSYLKEWCEISKNIDIATGYFEIGAFISLENKWQNVEKIRILMGDEVSLRTKKVFAEGLQKISGRLDVSIENEKTNNDFLEGVPAIVEGIRSGKIQCRVYRKDKFHAKAYLTHAKAAVIGSFALVGSSNFTYPGLSDNTELNVQIRGPEVGLLQEWYEKHWNDAEDVTADILQIIERHTKEYTPFDIWAKSLDELLRGHELTPDEWDERHSKIFKILAGYQKDAYKNLIRIADRFGISFLCDGVGLGKTFVGLMLLERMVVCEGKRVVLFAPKAAREDVWERAIEKYLPDLNSGFVNLIIYNHTDLQRKGKWPRDIELTLKDADVIIIDEAHHFRNPGVKGEGEAAPSRYRQFQKYLQNNIRSKKVYMLTATPVNNTIHDFRHMIELASSENIFTTQLGIHNLRSHFNAIEKQLLGQKEQDNLQLDFGTEIFEVEDKLREDSIFDALVIQRSRTYVKTSQIQQGINQILFPIREIPKVVIYNLKATYGKLLTAVEQAFNKKQPLFVLGLYYPLAYWKGKVDDPTYTSFDEGRQKQVVTLIRTLFLKRFESSVKAFEGSCWRLMQKLLAWITIHSENDHDIKRLERWKIAHGNLINYTQSANHDLWPDEAQEDEVEEFLTEDQLDAIKKLDKELFKIDEIIDNTYEDLNQLAEFLNLIANTKSENDDKLKALIKLLKTDQVLNKEKVLIFTEFAETARYLEKQLINSGFDKLCRIDGASTQKQRSDVIQRFSPYYNDSSSKKLTEEGRNEIRILISTDVLSEGLNLQDATRLINYDLHWNPVRLMQRIGRVDRRMNHEIEELIIKEHPELINSRGKTAYWNFIPPDELDELLKLFQKITKKTLVISRSLGIEGRKLLTPDDNFDPIKEMNEQCDGQLTSLESLRLEYEKLLSEYPELGINLHKFPLKVYSGKESHIDGAPYIFMCYRIPRPDNSLIESDNDLPRWSERAGMTVWICYDIKKEKTIFNVSLIANILRTKIDEPKVTKIDKIKLSTIRKSVEKQIISDYLKPLQAPLGISPILKCWMEIN